jgi:P-type conjugative transfer protein TrbJ
MKIKTASNLALAVALAMGAAQPAQAGIPVIDGANLSTNMISAYEEVAQTLKQIAEYKLQLDQYQNQLQNTLAPAAYLWDQAQATINNLMAAVNTLEGLKRKLGSLDGYLSKFQDINYYRNSPCFTSRGCSPAEMAALASVKELASESQKKANDALFKGLDLQQANLSSDALKLQMLQAGAQGAVGQMQAIGFANQLASQQANQLLQIRGLLVAQQNAIGTKMQADADKESQQNAAHVTSTESRINKTASPRNWLDLNR